MFVRKKRFCRVILILAVLAAAAVGGLFALRPDLRFIVKHEFIQLSKSADVTEISESSLTVYK